MKIPKKLQQFNNVPSLIIVTGTQKAHFYLAENGEVTRVETLIADKPHYSDREGFFAVRGQGGGMVRSGSVLKPVHKILEHDYKLTFKKYIRDIEKKFNIAEVWFLGTKHTYKQIEKTLSSNLHKKVKKIEANHCYEESPLEIVKRIQLWRQHIPITPLSSETKKILSTPRLSKKQIDRMERF